MKLPDRGQAPRKPADDFVAAEEAGRLSEQAAAAMARAVMSSTGVVWASERRHAPRRPALGGGSVAVAVDDMPAVSTSGARAMPATTSRSALGTGPETGGYAPATTRPGVLSRPHMAPDLRKRCGTCCGAVLD